MGRHSEPEEGVVPAEPARPALRIVRGEPTPEELAAVTVVLLSGGGDSDAPVAKPRSGWADPNFGVRGGHLPGAGRWASWR